MPMRANHNEISLVIQPVDSLSDTIVEPSHSVQEQLALELAVLVPIALRLLVQSPCTIRIVPCGRDCFRTDVAPIALI